MIHLCISWISWKCDITWQQSTGLQSTQPKHHTVQNHVSTEIKLRILHTWKLDNASNHSQYLAHTFVSLVKYSHTIQTVYTVHTSLHIVFHITSQCCTYHIGNVQSSSGHVFTLNEYWITHGFGYGLSSKLTLTYCVLFVMSLHHYATCHCFLSLVFGLQSYSLWIFSLA